MSGPAATDGCAGAAHSGPDPALPAVPGEGGFQTLIYTDCRPGQGLQGSGGLQFQARSAGADRTAMSVVQRNLLYEPPAKWMRERRPVADYPPSFAHIWDGCLATAAGVYLGREANGNREGNQLTHSIVTRDPQAYGLVRPAQLYQAPFWTTQPAPGTECPPLAPGWQPGPFDAEQVQRFVTDQPHGRRLLIALLSTLERVGESRAQRALFVAERPDDVLRWITAATLLLPQRRALAVGFKVFTTNPAYAAAPVLAVHPAWDSTTVRVGNDAGYAVFDLVHAEFSEVEPTLNAELWVDMFCTEDPYDVVDAVEVAAASGLPAHSAPVLGRAAVLRRRLSLPDAEVVVAWLRDSSPDLLPAHRRAVVDLLAESVDHWPRQVLLALDQVARSGQVPRDRIAAVRLALIRAEIEQAHDAAEVVGTPLPPLPPGGWHPEHQAAAEESIAAALRTARPAGFDAVLRVASRFGLAVRLAEVADAAYRFVVDWADHPERRYDVAAWPCGQQLEYQLCDELTERIVRDPDQRAGIGDHWWRRLLPSLEQVSGPLDRAVVAAAMLHSSPPARGKLVEDFLGGALHTQEPDRAAGRIAAVLWERTAPTPGELDALVRLAPEGTDLDQRIFDQLTGQLQYAPELSGDLVALAHHLVGLRLLRPEPPVAALLDADRALPELAGAAASVSDQAGRRAAVARLGAVPARVLILRTDPLLDRLLKIEDPVTVFEILAVVPEQVWREYLDRLAAAVREKGPPQLAVTAFHLGWRKDTRAEYQRRLVSSVVHWMQRASGKRAKMAAELVKALGPKWEETWLEEREDARRRNLLGRRPRAAEPEQ